MSKKEKFIDEVENLLFNAHKNLSEDAMAYFEILKTQKTENNKPKFTDRGKEILKYMQDNKDINNNIFNAKGIGEGLFISSRGVSGALRKLVTDEYVEKMGESPVSYSLTQKGIEENFDEAED